jgi:hypothetical protein
LEVFQDVGFSIVLTGCFFESATWLKISQVDWFVPKSGVQVTDSDGYDLPNLLRVTAESIFFDDL